MHKYKIKMMHCLINVRALTHRDKHLNPTMCNGHREEESRQTHAQCGSQRVGWACVYSSPGCCWLLMFLGKCNVLPNATGIRIAVGIEVSCFALAHAIILKARSNCLLSYELTRLFVFGWDCQAVASRR